MPLPLDKFKKLRKVRGIRFFFCSCGTKNMPTKGSKTCQCWKCKCKWKVHPSYVSRRTKSGTEMIQFED